jgi:hypothetical protein
MFPEWPGYMGTCYLLSLQGVCCGHFRAARDRAGLLQGRGTDVGCSVSLYFPVRLGFGTCWVCWVQGFPVFSWGGGCRVPQTPTACRVAHLLVLVGRIPWRGCTSIGPAVTRGRGACPSRLASLGGIGPLAAVANLLNFHRLTPIITYGTGPNSGDFAKEEGSSSMLLGAACCSARPEEEQYAVRCCALPPAHAGNRHCCGAANRWCIVLRSRTGLGAMCAPVLAACSAPRRDHGPVRGDRSQGGATIRNWASGSYPVPEWGTCALSAGCVCI